MKLLLEKIRWVIVIFILLSTYYNGVARNNRCTRCNPCYAAPITILPGQSDIILMYAEDFYSYMSVSVEKGEVYSFEVVRQYNYTDLAKATDADGWHNQMLKWKIARNGKRVDTAQCFVLCGAIGTKEDNLFSICKRRDNFTILATGNLHFFANDHKNFYWNNNGYLWIRVTREK